MDDMNCLNKNSGASNNLSTNYTKQFALMKLCKSTALDNKKYACLMKWLLLSASITNPQKNRIIVSLALSLRLRSMDLLDWKISHMDNTHSS